MCWSVKRSFWKCRLGFVICCSNEKKYNAATFVLNLPHWKLTNIPYPFQAFQIISAVFHTETNHLICKIMGYSIKCNKQIHLHLTLYTYILFYKQRFHKQRQAAIGKKIKQILSNTLRLNFCYLKIIYILHRCYHPKITGHKNKQKNKCVCIHEILWLIIMKIKDGELHKSS